MHYETIDLALPKEQFYKHHGRNKIVASYTLGCKVNQYDTEAILETFSENGYEIGHFDAFADIYIVNTCTVTHLSDRKCRQMFRKTKKMNPNSILIATGCYAQAQGEDIKEQIKEVDMVIGTHHRKEMPSYIIDFVKNEHSKTMFVEDINKVHEFEELTISNMGERTRAYLKIQEGCNNYCTYCIIPYVRGNIRSRQEANAVEEAKRLVAAGFKEIVLTGIHVASYGKDLKTTNLMQIIKKVHEIPGLERIRLSSIEPVVITDDFLEEIQSLPKLCRHFHLSLQSGSDTVLKRMNRKYTTKEYADSIERLRNIWPDVAITTDIIVGFPGETEEEFKQTLEFVQQVKLAQIHIFPFSPRKGTPAATMKNQVEPQVKEERVKALTKIAHAMQENFMEQFIGKTVEVLFEQYKENKLIGYTSNYIKVEVTSMENLHNQLEKVVIDSITEGNLNGHLL